MHSSSKERLALLWDHPDTQSAFEATRDPAQHNFVPDPVAPDSCFSCGFSEGAHEHVRPMSFDPRVIMGPRVEVPWSLRVALTLL